jgi:hypothetical protein
VAELGASGLQIVCGDLAGLRAVFYTRATADGGGLVWASQAAPLASRARTTVDVEQLTAVSNSANRTSLKASSRNRGAYKAGATAFCRTARTWPSSAPCAVRAVARGSAGETMLGGAVGGPDPLGAKDPRQQIPTRPRSPLLASIP